MRTRPREDVLHLLPITYIFELQLLNGSASDNHAVILLIPHLLKSTVEHHHVFDGRVLGGVALQFHKTDFELQGSVRQEPYQICFRRNLQRHQVEDDNLQRTDILHVSTGIVHHEDVLMFQQLNGRKSIG